MGSPLDSRQIRAFCVLARTGSFTQIPSELHLTQSGISHSMKTLQTGIGCRLLDRLGKNIVLTQAGEQLLHHTKKIESVPIWEGVGQAAKRQRNSLKNHRHKLFGHVFSGRYKLQLVEGSGNGYLRTVCDYVHLNPVRANLLQPEERLLAYPWSSFGYYLCAPEHRPGWLRVDRLLGEHGIGGDTPAGRQEFERRMEARRLQPGDEEGLRVFRRGWCVGSETFRTEQLERMEGKLGEQHSGELRLETAMAKAKRIIAEELSRLGWTEGELAGRRKNDPGKMAVAVRLRRETTLSVKQIAARCIWARLRRRTSGCIER